MFSPQVSGSDVLECSAASFENIYTMSENQQTRRRVSYTQLQNLWEFLNNHRDIASGYNKSAQAREHSKQLWLRVASILNSAGEGAVKSGPEWSKYWVDLKAKIKKKNRIIRDSRSHTGGGPSAEPDLTEMEVKFLQILGEDYGSGLPGVQVLPFDVQDNAEILFTHPDPTQPTPSEEGSEHAMYLMIDSGEYQNAQQIEASSLGEASAERVPSSQPSTSSTQMLSLHQPSSTPPPSARRESRPPSARRESQPPSARRESPPPSARRESPPPSARRETPPPSARRESPPSASQTPRSRRNLLRRRRRRRAILTVADAREQLVSASQTRAQAEFANSRSIEQAVGIFGEMVSILRRIEARLPGEDPIGD